MRTRLGHVLDGEMADRQGPEMGANRFRAKALRSLRFVLPPRDPTQVPKGTVRLT